MDKRDDVHDLESKMKADVKATVEELTSLKVTMCEIKEEKDRLNTNIEQLEKDNKV